MDLNGIGFFNQVKNPIKHVKTSTIINMIDSAIAFSPASPKYPKHSTNVASLVPIPEIDIGMNVIIVAMLNVPINAR